MKKYVALFLIAVTLLTLAACGSKDALAGTWSADLGDDGVITWTFNGKGKCTMENAYIKQNGTYTIDGDQLTVTLEAWSEPSTYTFSVDGSSLTICPDFWRINTMSALKTAGSGRTSAAQARWCLRWNARFRATPPAMKRAGIST